CSITEFVYLVEAHHHLNPIFVLKDNSPRRLDDGVVMLVLEAHGHPLRFGEVHLSLVAFNPKLEVFYALAYNQLSGPLVDGRSGPPSGNGLLTLFLNMGSSTLSQELVAFFHLNQSINMAISSVCARSESSGGGSRVAGHSSSKGFHQPWLKFTVGIWALSMSSSSDDCACSSGAIFSSISRFAWQSLWMDFLGLWMTVEVVMVALRLIQKLQKPSKLRKGPLVEEEEVAYEMETQSDHSSLTFQELQIAACGHHETCRNQLPTCASEGSLSYQPLIRSAMMCSNSPMRFTNMASVVLCCGACGGGNVVVVVVVVVVMLVVVALSC
nr:hypothetical protein [Tanacetum cinerariifolium]